MPDIRESAIKPATAFVKSSSGGVQKAPGSFHRRGGAHGSSSLRPGRAPSLGRRLPAISSDDEASPAVCAGEGRIAAIGSGAQRLAWNPETELVVAPLGGDSQKEALMAAANEYRAKAWECLSLAGSMNNPEERAEMLRFARMWMSLAEPVEELRGSYELPRWR
jgi:hypothetical protein